MLVPLAVLGLALSAGCGDKDAGTGAAGPAGAAGPTGAAAHSDADVEQVRYENLVADCMKKQGFRYAPRPPLPMGDDDQGRFTGPASVLEPADEVREFRQKYGFGVFARLVYPNDPAVAVPDIDPAKNPNNAIRDGLDPARRKAYDLALQGAADVQTDEDKARKKADSGPQGCSGEASEQVYGPATRDEADSKAAERAYAAFQTDPDAVAAAQKYADCLRGRGYRVRSARPGEVESSMSEAAMDGNLPAEGPDGGKVPTGGAATAAVAGAAPVEPEVARAGLEREIKAALADLDCRTGYAALVRAKHAKTITAGRGQG
jgi:hypothetical protein